MLLNQDILDDLIFSLKKVKYKNIIQNLKLEYKELNECPYIYLALINIKKSVQNKGYGSAIMSEIISLADKYNIQIQLYATTVYGANKRRLYAFYRKHGFVLTRKNIDGRFIYYPQKNKKK